MLTTAADEPRVRRALPDGVLRALLHSAVALQAEVLLRTVGALATAAHRSEPRTGAVDWVAWVERDVRDLGLLARAALDAGAALPAGLDVGSGDPDRPESLIEGLLAGHEAVLRALRDLLAAGGGRPWDDVVDRLAARRAAEAAALRVSIGDPDPPAAEPLRVGRPPDQHFTPDLLV